MKTIRFTYTDQYRCSEPGDMSGEYVRADVARELVAACEAIWHAWRWHHQIDDPEWEGFRPLLGVRAALALANGGELKSIPPEVVSALNDPHYPQPWSLEHCSEDCRHIAGLCSRVGGVKRFFYTSDNEEWLSRILREVQANLAARALAKGEGKP